MFLQYSPTIGTEYLLLTIGYNQMDCLIGTKEEVSVVKFFLTETNGVFFSTKKCALYFKKLNFVFVS